MKASPARHHYLKWLTALFCFLVIGNCQLVGSLGGQPLRRFGEHAELGNAGIGFVFLWTRYPGSSIAWDCLPGALPEFTIRDDYVFIVFPLWIPFIPMAILTISLFWRDQRRLERLSRDPESPGTTP